MEYSKSGEASHIIFFDGKCNLCNRLVQFVIKRDTSGKFKFASLQSKIGQEILEGYGVCASDLDSFVLVIGEHFFVRSSAVLKLFCELGGVWKFLYVLILVPRPLRDFVYNCIANSRYRLFGKKDSCMIPSEGIRKRFLE